VSLSPKAYDLALASDVAADFGGTADDRTQRALSAASKAIASWCIRTFEKSSAIVEYPASTGRALLSLKRPPIASIASITENGTVVASGDYESTGDNVNAGLVLHKYRGWYRTDRLDPYAVSATRSLNAGQSDLIVVTYAGGYVTPGQNALDAVTYPTVDLPEDVQEAAIFTACAFLRLKGTDPNVKSEAIGDWSISFFDAKTADGNAVPAYARALLAPYKLGWAL
jgi:hypothetical protein